MPDEVPGKASGKGEPDPATVVDDLFRRVSGLNGFLIVAFVAPVGAPGHAGAADSALAAVAGEAAEKNRELTQRVIERFQGNKKD